MKKYFRKIIKALFKYKGGFFGNANIEVKSDRITVYYFDYIIYFQILPNKPYGCLEIYHTSKYQSYELTFESDYNNYGYVNRTAYNLLHHQTTDNHAYITRTIDNLIFNLDT